MGWLVTASAEDDPPGAIAACGPLPGDRRGYSELSTVPQGTASDFAALGNLPCNAPLSITNPANNKSVIANKVDKGAGSSFLPVMGLYPQTRADLGLDNNGEYHIVINAAPGGPTPRPVRSSPSAINGGTFGAGGTGTANTQTPASAWTVGDASNPDQDYWTCINQYSQNGQLYCFSDAEELIVADGIKLMAQQPAAVIVRNDPSVLRAECTYDNPLALDTSIPTPDGWTTMGEIQTGDLVFGADGKPQRVLGTSPVFLGRDCYRVVFSDGTAIVADATHEWETTVGSARAVRKTREIAGHEIDRPTGERWTVRALATVPPVPTRCILVENDDHLFLAGESMIPTRNTAFQYVSTHTKRGHVQRRSTLAKVTSPTEVTLRLVCPIDQIRAGDVVWLKSFGPADGFWLVGNATRSIFQPYSELTLVQALQPINAATGTQAGASTGSNTTQGGAPMVNGATNPAPGASWSRLDMGFDGNYDMSKGAVAPYNGTVHTNLESGWPGQGSYFAIVNDNQSGPDYTRAMYFAEGATPIVADGQHVTAGQKIGNPVQSGGDGAPGNFEIGPAQASPPYDCLAKAYGLGTSGARQMVISFANWLKTLGASEPTDTSVAGNT